MSILFYDSFSNYEFLPMKYENVTSYSNFHIKDGIGRKGGQCLYSYSDFTIRNEDFIQKDLNYNYSEIILGFAFKKVNSDGGYLQIDFCDGDDVQSKVKLYNNSCIWYNHDETESRGLSATHAVGTWTYFEIKIKAHTVSGTLDIRFDEYSCINYSNLSSSLNSNYINNLKFKSLPNNYTYSDFVYIEGLYITTTSGVANNDFLGNCEVSLLYPQEQGTYSEFSLAPTFSGIENYELVNERVLLDDTTTYSQDFLVYNITDDGYEVPSSSPVFGNTTILVPDDNSFVGSGNPPSYFWFKFSEISIPKNARITNAHLDVYRELYSNVEYPDDNILTIAAENSGNGSSVPMALGQVTTWPLTSISANASLGTHPNDLDLSAVIQELVNLSDWEAFNNTVTIMLNMRYADNELESWVDIRYRAHAYYNDPYHANATKLHVEWTIPYDDSGEYIHTSDKDIRDSYNMTSYSGTNSIYAVNHNIFTKRLLAPSNPDNLKIVSTYINGTTYSGIPTLPKDEMYFCNSSISELNPKTMLDWEVSDLTTAEFGFTTISG